MPKGIKMTHLRPIHKSEHKKSANCYKLIGSVFVMRNILENYIWEQLKKNIQQAMKQLI